MQGLTATWSLVSRDHRIMYGGYIGIAEEKMETIIL